MSVKVTGSARVRMEKSFFQVVESNSGSSLMALIATPLFSFPMLCPPTSTLIVETVFRFVQRAVVNTWLSDIKVPPHLRSKNKSMMCCMYIISSITLPRFTLSVIQDAHVPGVLMRLRVLTSSNPVPVGEAAVTILTLAYTKSKVVLNVLNKSDGFYTEFLIFIFFFNFYRF